MQKNNAYVESVRSEYGIHFHLPIRLTVMVGRSFRCSGQLQLVRCMETSATVAVRVSESYFKNASRIVIKRKMSITLVVAIVES